MILKRRKKKALKSTKPLVKLNSLYGLVILVFWQCESIASTNISIQSKLELADEIRSSNPEKFSKLLKQLALEQERLSTAQKDRLKYLEAFNLSLSGQMLEALKSYEVLYQDSTDNKIRFRAISSMVNTHAVTRDYYNGSIALRNLQIESESIEDEHLINHGLLIQGSFYNQSGQYSLAKQRASQIINSDAELKHKCVARQLLIESNFYLNSLSDNENFTTESIEYCRSIKEPVVAGIIIVFKGKELLKEKRFKEAYNSLIREEEYVKQTGYPWLISNYLLTLGQIEFELTHYDSAKKLLESALENSGTLGNSKPLVEVYKTLATIAERNENYKEALSYQQYFSDAEKAYMDEVRVRELAVQRAKHEYREQENQITLLDKENSLLKTQAELSRKEAQNNQLLLALASILVILLFLWTYRSRRVQIKLRKMAQTDALTGINNRNHFTVSAEHQLRQSRHTKIPVSFILFDLDLFKKINDTYGHQTGDWALRHAVDAAKSVCRSNDIIGRMGGEEFALLLPNCSADKAAKIAEMCRKAIENIKTGESGYEFNITASFGVSDSSTCEYDFDKLYGCADSALYKSKSQGRNQVYQFNADEKPVFG